MNASRGLFGAVVAIALFTLGMVAAIAWVTCDEPASVPGRTETGPPSRATGGWVASRSPVPPPEALPALPSNAPPPAAAPASTVPSRPSSTDGSRQRAASTVERQHNRVSFRSELAAAIAALEERVARCAAERLESASFQLSVEAVEGGVRIADAEVETRGEAGDAELGCARSALRGQLLPVPSVEPGRRWRMPFSVHPVTFEAGAGKGARPARRG